MNLVNPLYLWLLILCVLLVVMLFSRRRRLARRFSSFASPVFEKHYYRERSVFWYGLKLFLGILALVSIIIALVRPQWDFENRTLDKKGMDILFIIDVSKSMDAQDIMPSRLLRAIIQISAFMDELDTDHIGIISFAGVAKLECPLTDDYDAIRIVLQGLSTNSAERPGTNIGSALSLALQAFQGASQTNSIVLVSDGEDLQGEGVKQASELHKKGIRLYTMGVGSPEGATITNPATGQEVTSRLDEKTLQQLASNTGGEYYRITPGGDEIGIVLRRIHEREESRMSSKHISIMKEQYYLFALLALILLLIEMLIDPKTRTKGIMAAENQNAD